MAALYNRVAAKSGLAAREAVLWHGTFSEQSTYSTICKTPQLPRKKNQRLLMTNHT